LDDARYPRLTISVLCLNRADMTRACLEAVRAHTLGSYELLVHDNGSTDETPALLAQTAMLMPLTVTRSEKNEGCIVPHNRNVRAARGRFFCTLNNDAVVSPGWDDAMIAPFADPLVGATGPPDSHGCLGDDMIGRPCPPGAQPDYLGGHCLMTTRDIVDRIGLFDEGLKWMYGDDSDFCLRLRTQGYKLQRVDVPISHAVGATVKTVPQELLGFDPAEVHRRNHAFLRKRWAWYFQARKAAGV
jgi:GT2 family glycosyltransferase